MKLRAELTQNGLTSGVRLYDADTGVFVASAQWDTRTERLAATAELYTRAEKLGYSKGAAIQAVRTEAGYE